MLGTYTAVPRPDWIVGELKIISIRGRELLVANAREWLCSFDAAYLEGDYQTRVLLYDITCLFLEDVEYIESLQSLENMTMVSLGQTACVTNMDRMNIRMWCWTGVATVTIGAVSYNWWPVYWMRFSCASSATCSSSTFSLTSSSITQFSFSSSSHRLNLPSSPGYWSPYWIDFSLLMVKLCHRPRVKSRMI